MSPIGARVTTDYTKLDFTSSTLTKRENQVKHNTVSIGQVISRWWNPRSSIALRVHPHSSLLLEIPQIAKPSADIE